MDNNTKHKNQGPTAQSAFVEERSLRRQPLIFGIAFVAITWLLLNVFEHEFLFRAQELSLWLPTKIYFDERMLVPGGFINYVACFLTQFFYYPLLGSLIFVGLLFVVQLLTQKAFTFPVRWGLLAILPSVLILCCAMEAGYWIFQIKTQGYLYSMLVGFLSTLSVLCLYRRVKGFWRYLIIIGIAAVGYPLFGFYALLALLTIVAFSLRSSDEGRWGIVLLALVAACATPILY